MAVKTPDSYGSILSHKSCALSSKSPHPPTHLGHVRMFCHLGNCPSESKGWKFSHENINVTKSKSGFHPVSAQNEGQHVANWAAQLLLWCICAVLPGLSNDHNSVCVCVTFTLEQNTHLGLKVATVLDDDFNKSVCEGEYMCVCAVSSIPLCLPSLSMFRPLTRSSDLPRAECSLVVQLWKRLCVCAWAHLWSGYILEELRAALCVKKPDKHICLFPCGVIVALFALTPSLCSEISVTAPLCSQIPCPLCRRTAELHSSPSWTRNRSRKTKPSHPVALEPQQIYFCMHNFETATNEVKRCAGDAYEVVF